jgi:GMP synthase (glutamine-hydrolysing)
MHILGVIHGKAVRAGVFGDVVAERGHTVEEWSLAWDRPLPRPLDAYGGVLVFGGSIHADQDDRHPWLREENLFLQRLLDLHKPLLGICLGAQLIAKAAQAAVFPASRPEIGWYPVELTADAADDPLLARLPSRFRAFQWHYYAHALPAGAVELARNEVGTQAFRLGDSAWGVQFHPEVTLPQVEGWLEEDEPYEFDREGLRAQTYERISQWNEVGRTLCDAFLDVAERVAAPA